MMAFCLNYTIFLNTSLNSPLTQTMCGNLKVSNCDINLLDVLEDLTEKSNEFPYHSLKEHGLSLSFEVSNVQLVQDLGTVLIGWLWFGGLPFDWVRLFTMAFDCLCEDSLSSDRNPLQVLQRVDVSDLYTVDVEDVFICTLSYILIVVSCFFNCSSMSSANFWALLDQACMHIVN